MKEPEQVIVNSIDLEVTADAAFSLLSDADKLRKWFAHDVSIEQKVGGAFTFAGDGAYQPTSTVLTRYEPRRLLRGTGRRTARLAR